MLRYVSERLNCILDIFEVKLWNNEWVLEMSGPLIFSLLHVLVLLINLVWLLIVPTCSIFLIDGLLAFFIKSFLPFTLRFLFDDFLFSWRHCHRLSGLGTSLLTLGNILRPFLRWGWIEPDTSTICYPASVSCSAKIVVAIPIASWHERPSRMQNICRWFLTKDVISLVESRPSWWGSHSLVGK